MARATTDERIWEYAAAKGFTILTADSDFIDLSNSRGAPPKVVHLENCDYRTSQVEGLLRQHAIWIAEFGTVGANHAGYSQEDLTHCATLAEGGRSRLHFKPSYLPAAKIAPNSSGGTTSNCA